MLNKRTKREWDSLKKWWCAANVNSVGKKESRTRSRMKTREKKKWKKNQPKNHTMGSRAISAFCFFLSSFVSLSIWCQRQNNAAANHSIHGKWLLNRASIVESIKPNNHNWCPRVISLTHSHSHSYCGLVTIFCYAFNWFIRWCLIIHRCLVHWVAIKKPCLCARIMLIWCVLFSALLHFGLRLYWLRLCDGKN